MKRQVQRNRRPGVVKARRVTARDVMTPVSELACASPGQDAFEALSVLAQRNVNQLPVLDGHTLVGMLRREDILKWLSLREVAAPDPHAPGSRPTSGG